jgi:hypothetical protein
MDYPDNPRISKISRMKLLLRPTPDLHQLPYTIVFPVVSNTVFLSVRSSLIAIGFGSSSQLLSRGFSFRHDGGEGSRRKREEGKGAGKARVADQTVGTTERASTPSSICLSDPQGREKAVAQDGAQNSIQKRVHFGTHRSRVSVHASYEALTLHSPVAHPGSPCSRGASV